MQVLALYKTLDSDRAASFIAFQSRADFERGGNYVKGLVQGYYFLWWGWIQQRLGDTRPGLRMIEEALEIGQNQDQQLELKALNHLANGYLARGQTKLHWNSLSECSSYHAL